MALSVRGKRHDDPVSKRRYGMKEQGLVAEIVTRPASLLYGCLCSYFDRYQWIQIFSGIVEPAGTSRDFGVKL